MPQLQSIGANINGQGISADLVTSWTSQSNARTHLVINESKLAALIQGHTPRVIYRMKGSAGIVDDDHAHEKHNPREFARTINILAPQGCLVYGGNEPGSETLDKLNNWTLAFVDESVKQGRKPVVFNNFVFHPKQRLAAWHILKPAGMAALQASGSIGVHIYFNRTIAASRDAFQVIDDVQQTFGDVPIDVTEYACAPDYDPFRGFADAISEDQFTEELTAGVEEFGGANINWQVYIYGLWAQGRGYEITHAEKVKRGITEFNKRMAEVDYGTKQPQGRVTLKNASGVRFREAPVNGAVIDTFKGGEIVAFWDKVGSDGWRKIEWNGRVGYASAQYIDVTAVAPTQPPVIPEFPDTPEAAKNLITIAKQLEVAGQATYQAAAELRGWLEWWLERNGVDIAA